MSIAWHIFFKGFFPVLYYLILIKILFINLFNILSFYRWKNWKEESWSCIANMAWISTRIFFTQNINPKALFQSTIWLLNRKTGTELSYHWFLHSVLLLYMANSKAQPVLQKKEKREACSGYKHTNIHMYIHMYIFVCMIIWLVFYMFYFCIKIFFLRLRYKCLVYLYLGIQKKKLKTLNLLQELTKYLAWFISHPPPRWLFYCLF